jgi:hypothetical protein
MFYRVLNFFLKRTCVLCGFVENNILQIARNSSVFTKDVFDISFVNGPGLTSTFPIISVK